MSERIGSFLAGGHGPVHTGDGDQIIINDPSELLRNAHGQTPRTIAEDQLRWLRQRFVPPSGLDEARKLLRQSGTVLLNGDPGSGRHSAAQMLLHELAKDEGTFHELTPEGERKKPYLIADHVGENDRLLLNMSTRDESLWSDIQDELSSFRQTVVERRAHLVVVLPDRLAHRLDPPFQRFRADIDRPSGREVLRRYARLSGIAPDETAVLPADLVSYLDRNPPLRDIAALAHYLARARTASPGPGGFPKWCDEALGAMTDRAKQAADDVASLRGGPQRALLLSTAMLHGAHADAVHRATRDLLRTVGHPDDPVPPLERADLAERFRSINAERDAKGRVRFTGLGYAPAVRTHFWATMPELRRHFRVWVGSTVELRTLTQDNRDRLIARFAEQCLRTERPGDLVTLVEQWTGSAPADASLRTIRQRAAAHSLEHGLTHESWGHYFRTKTYDWSRERRLAPGLAEVLVGVCGEVMAVRYPDQAMVRLHHLARRERGTTTARDALLRLVSDDRRLHHRLLDRLDRGIALAEWPADVDLFLALADSVPARPSLVTGSGMRRQWAACWRAALQLRPRGAWSAPMERWLAVASEDSRYREGLLSVLVDSGGGRSDLLSLLYVATRDWARSAESPSDHSPRTDLADRFLQMIDAAQGL
ncbi:hypothetical protein [Streptomyces sp. NPDC000405]|uniref:nSTAND3 domain-containing NTPase n=1 Tax=Streptomyces sp. NPDC000405 TaxID=3161033 RepID=UPI00398CAE66